MNGYYAKVVEQLKKHGYKHSGPGRGSHEIWSNGKHNQTVPFHCKSRHTAIDIM